MWVAVGVLLSVATAVNAQASIVSDTFAPIAMCVDQRHFFGSNAYAVPEFIGSGKFRPDDLSNPPERESWVDGPDRVAVGSEFSPVARRAMCEACSVLFTSVFSSFRERQLGIATNDDGYDVLAPPHHLCREFRTAARFARPGRDESHLDHLELKKRDFCRRLVRGLQRRYGSSAERTPGNGLGGRFFPDPSELKPNVRELSFEAASRNVYQQVYLQRDFTPDLPKDKQASYEACSQLKCC